MTSPSVRKFISVLAVTASLVGGRVLAQTPDLSSLHDALHLSRGQEEAWRTYLAAVAPDPTAESRERSAAMLAATLPTPRRVDLINAEMEEDMKAVRRQGEAVKVFYGALSPDQQRTFDKQTLQAGQGQGQGSFAPAQGQAPLRQPPNGQLRQP